MNISLSVRIVKFTQPEVRVLVDELDAYQAQYYPQSSLYCDPPEKMDEENSFCVAAYHGKEVVGIGGLKFASDYAEIKRVYVRERVRSTGVGDVIVASLEKQAWDQGLKFCYLETGIHHEAALRFYKGLGYKNRKIFGDYKTDPHSVYLEKKIAFQGTHKKEARYVAAFRSRLSKKAKGYAPFADEIAKHALQYAGLVALQSNRNADGMGFTASYWVDLEGMHEWKNDPHHQEAKRRGREEFYESFRLTLARLDRAR